MSTAIHDKIAKLLALGKNNPNEHEAETAMRFAMALMLKHNISEDDIETDDEKPKVTRGDPLEAEKAWHSYASSSAQVLYSVRALWVKDKFLFVGRADNVDAAQMTYTMICDQVEALYKHNLPPGMTKAARAAYRRDFKLACAMRVYSRACAIVAQFEKDEAQALKAIGSTALVIVKKRKQLEQEIEDFFTTLGTIKARAERSLVIKNRPGTQDGFRAGEHVELNRRVK